MITRASVLKTLHQGVPLIPADFNSLTDKDVIRAQFGHPERCVVMNAINRIFGKDAGLAMGYNDIVFGTVNNQTQQAISLKLSPLHLFRCAKELLSGEEVAYIDLADFETKKITQPLEEVNA